MAEERKGFGERAAPDAARHALTVLTRLAHRDEAQRRWLALALERYLPPFRYTQAEVVPWVNRWLAPLGKAGPLLVAMYYLNATPE